MRGCKFPRSEGTLVLRKPVLQADKTHCGSKRRAIGTGLRRRRGAGERTNANHTGAFCGSVLLPPPPRCSFAGRCRMSLLPTGQFPVLPGVLNRLRRCQKESTCSFFSKPYFPVTPEHALEWANCSPLTRGATI